MEEYVDKGSVQHPEGGSLLKVKCNTHRHMTSHYLQPCAYIPPRTCGVIKSFFDKPLI